MPQSSDETIERAMAGSGIAVPDEEHARRCAGFAGALFDALHERLGLDADERPLAVLAALFHDVGYLRGARDHHRKSFDIIRDASIPGLSDHDRLIVALAARYHGHTLPNIEHAGFVDLSFEDQRRVRRLSGVVRLAVALDSSHLGFVNGVEVEHQDDGVQLIVHASQEPSVERDQLYGAAGGFTELTKVPLQMRIIVGPSKAG